MRTLSKIIEMTKDGGRPEYDELRYALVAMCALKHFDFQAIMKLRKAEEAGKKPFRSATSECDESFNRFKSALAIDPKTYCGPSHDPDTEECQRFRRASKNILSAVEKKMEASSK